MLTSNKLVFIKLEVEFKRPIRDFVRSDYWRSQYKFDTRLQNAFYPLWNNGLIDKIAYYKCTEYGKYGFKHVITKNSNRTPWGSTEIDLFHYLVRLSSDLKCNMGRYGIRYFQLIKCTAINPTKTEEEIITTYGTKRKPRKRKKSKGLK